MSDQLYSSLLDACDYLEQKGVTLPDEVKQLRRRDKREPQRKDKELGEQRLARLFQRIFRKQAAQVRQHLESHAPDRKANVYIPPIDFEDIEPEDMGELVRALTEFVKGGITLFNDSIGIEMDTTLVNMRAAKWARENAGELIKKVLETTRRAVREAIALFVETPGMTIRDVVNLLPFDEKRALNIATTETTRAYAQGNQMAGEALREEFPGVKVVKMWFTNVDDRVCEICGPLEGKTVELEEDFEEGIDNPPAHPNCRCWTTTTTDIER